MFTPIQAIDNNCGCDKYITNYAAEGGDIKVLKLLHKKGYDYNPDILCSAARGSHYGRHCVSSYKECSMCKNAIKVFNYLQRKKKIKKVYPIVTYDVAKQGYLDVLKYLRANIDKVLNDNTFRFAVEGGHMYIIEFLKQVQCKRHDDIASEALLQNNLELVKWRERHM